MALTFQVMNRNDANRYCYKAHQAATAIISISSWYDEQVRLFQTPQNNIKSIFRVTFNDVGADGVGHMTEEDAAKIANYVKHIAEKVDQLIVHCDAGVSRSAGTCAAIMKALTEDDSQIFDDPFFKPNMHCYRLVLEAMHGLGYC